MKTKVLDFLKNPPLKTGEKFNKAIDLAVKSGLHPHLVNRFNRNGATKRNTESIIYELQKFHKISKVEIAKHQVKEQSTVDPQLDNTGQVVSADLSDIQKDPFKNVLREMNAEQKQGLRFREQYPFLKDKETPNELKVLTSDAISSFENYKEKHQELFDNLVNVSEPKLTNEEVFAIANNLLEDFEENRAIHAELEHYAKTKEILGEHEIFSGLKLQREIEAIPAANLGQEKANITSNISKKKAAQKKAKTKETKEKYAEEIKALENRRTLVNERIKTESEPEEK